MSGDLRFVDAFLDDQITEAEFRQAYRLERLRTRPRDSADRRRKAAASSRCRKSRPDPVQSPAVARQPTSRDLTSSETAGGPPPNRNDPFLEVEARLSQLLETRPELARLSEFGGDAEEDRVAGIVREAAEHLGFGDSPSLSPDRGE